MIPSRLVIFWQSRYLFQKLKCPVRSTENLYTLLSYHGYIHFFIKKVQKLFRQLVCQTRSWVFAKFFGLKFKLRKRNEIPDFRWVSLSLRERIRVWYGIMKLYTSWNTYELPYQSRDSYLGTKLLGGRSFFSYRASLNIPFSVY